MYINNTRTSNKADFDTIEASKYLYINIHITGLCRKHFNTSES